MTQSTYRRKNFVAILKSFLAFSAFMLFSVFVSDTVSEHVLEGIIFSAKVILPTVFPFMVFSDFASHCFEFEKSRILSSVFERCFKISRVGISAFLSGIVGGFPVGAKNSLALYENGKISKGECERLMSFSNLASPAYVISAIGIGIMSDFKIGVILYAVIIISSVICGFIIGINKDFSDISHLKTEQNYNFVTSLKNSASASVNVLFFISFFSGICGLIKSLPFSNIPKCFILSFIEVGNASTYISDSHIFSSKLSLAIIAFSLSFSGLSVIAQSLAIGKGSEMSIKKCVLYKLLQGFISFIIILLLPL